MSTLKLWEEHPDRGADGIARITTPAGEAQIGHVEDSSDGVLLVWRGPKRGRPPLRIVDPLGGDPVTVAAELIASEREAAQ